MLGTRGERRRVRVMVGGLAALMLVAASCSDDGDDDDGGGGDGGGYEATITRTDDGVPHITGDSFADVAFGQGYAGGEDRACDLADQVVKLRAERAAHFGPGEEDEHITSDLTWRAIGLFDRASEDWEDASDEVVEVITAYTEGWNAHLDEVGVDGLSGWCAGEDWVRPLEPVEVYTYGRSVAIMASSGNPDLGPMFATARPPGDEETGAGDDSAEDAGDESDEGGTDDDADDEEEAAAAFDALSPDTGQVGSNAWAIGAERSESGNGLLVGNPHFPWEGENRFWEVHLTVSGEVDAHGGQLSGLPGIGLGFNEDVAWSHTVSAGHRFTVYQLDLVDGDPTSYHYGDEVREMSSEEVTIEVLGADGEVEEHTQTLWRSHYGPIIDFPGFGWTGDSTLALRDANLDNTALFEQYLAMTSADSLDALIDAHREHNGVPLFNTIAASTEGEAWYADTSATPNLSDEAIDTWERALEDDPIVGVAADNGAVLLDGSDPANEWVEVDGARSPGLVPFDDQPQMQRDDYVLNANDPFTVPHAEEWLDEGYSPLHGFLTAGYSPRTRENLTIVSDTSDEGPAGEGGEFSLDELADAALQNTGYTSRVLRDEVVERCEGETTVDVPALEREEGEEALPAATVDISDACDVLAEWDGVYDLDRAGPAVWRELVSQVDFPQLQDAGELWAEPFDPDDPVGTPSGLVGAGDGDTDPALVLLARSVQILDEVGLEVDVPLGEVQVAPRAGELVPIHGGDAWDGTTNIVGWGSFYSILDPALSDGPENLVPHTSLYDLDGEAVYPVNNGTSFIFAVELTDDGPEARVLHSYGNPEDRDAAAYLESTERFSDKDWRTVEPGGDVAAEDGAETVTVSG